MSRSQLLTALCLAGAVLAASPVAADTYRSYRNGGQYMDMSEDLRTTYVEGLADMTFRMESAVDNPSEKVFLDRIRRCTAGMTSAQLRAFVDDYMARDQSYRGDAMASNFRAAMNTKCPS